MHGHKIINQNKLHFITCTVVGWLDVFTRSKYKDIIIDSLNFDYVEGEGLIEVELIDLGFTEGFVPT